jgi:hypothetical protein
MPRWLWWLIGFMSTLDLALNVWSFKHDRVQWHLDVAIMSVITILAAAIQLHRKRAAR